MKLRNEYKKLAITLAVLASCSSAVFAADNAFTPLNFDDNYTPPPAAAKAPAVKKVADTGKAIKASDAAAVDKNGEVPIGNGNIQNAILELDNAQVGIRNDLLNYKAKYSDVDAQYKLIKNERNMLNKQVKSIERRIKDIDKAKEKIRKNML
jgi:hypothetical protein